MSNDFYLTPHFKLSELVETNNKELKEKNLISAQKEMGRMYQLAGFAERVREIVGYPLIVTSGYRCKELNIAVGGSLASQHLYGEAIDIVCKRLTVKGLFNRIKKSDLKYDQMIIETNKAGAEWLHLSIGSKKQRLEYSNGKYTQLD